MKEKELCYYPPLSIRMDKSPKQTIRGCLPSTAHVDKTSRGRCLVDYKLSLLKLGIKANPWHNVGGALFLKKNSHPLRDLNH